MDTDHCQFSMFFFSQNLRVEFEDNAPSSMKHFGGSIKLWKCLKAASLGRFVKIEIK